MTIPPLSAITSIVRIRGGAGAAVKKGQTRFSLGKRRTGIIFPDPAILSYNDNFKHIDPFPGKRQKQRSGPVRSVDIPPYPLRLGSENDTKHLYGTCDWRREAVPEENLECGMPVAIVKWSTFP
jgi:hypothetical protein